MRVMATDDQMCHCSTAPCISNPRIAADHVAVLVSADIAKPESKLTITLANRLQCRNAVMASDPGRKFYFWIVFRSLYCGGWARVLPYAAVCFRILVMGAPTGYRRIDGRGRS